MTLTEEYKNKLEGILLIRTHEEAAELIGCKKRVIGYWKNNPGRMQLKFAESINRVYNDNSAVIARCKKR